MNPYSAYAQANVMTDEYDKGKILVKVLRALDEKIDGVKVMISQKRYDAKFAELNKIANIITVLDSSLDMSLGEIPRNLSSLYNYVIRKLLEVHGSLDTQTLDECKAIIKSLAEGFEAAEQTLRKGHQRPQVERTGQLTGSATI